MVERRNLSCFFFVQYCEYACLFVDTNAQGWNPLTDLLGGLTEWSFFFRTDPLKWNDDPQLANILG